MVVALSSLRVGAEMDASKYTAGMSAKVAADKEGAASSVAVGEALTATNTKISQSGDLLTRLRRQYVDGAANAMRFESAINALGRGIDRGAVPLSQVSSILDGIYKKYQLTADAALLMERGQLELAQAVEAANAKLKQQNSIVPANQNTRNGAHTFQTANIAAQFQDVAVTAAMGMNPLQIALQQGTQLSSVLATMGSGREILGGLAAAFTSLVSPVSLVTIGLVAAGAAAIQYFGSVSGGSGKSEEALQKEIELIQRVAEKWGEALPALKSYAEEQKRLANNQDILGASAAEASKQWDSLRNTASDLKMNFQDLVSQLQLAGADDENILRLQTAFNRLTKGIDDGTATAKNAQTVQDDLATFVNSTGIPAVSTFAGQFNALATAISTASAKAAELREQAGFLANFPNSVLPALNGLTQPISDMGNLITNANDQQTYRAQQYDNENPTVLSNGVYIPVPTPDKRPNIELEGLPGADKIDRSAQSARNAYRDVIKNANDRIQQMQQEAQTAGQTGIAAETLSFKLKILQDATDKGRTVTAAQRAEIDKLAESYRVAATAAASAKLGQDIAFQQRQLGRSSLDQTVASTLQQYGLPENLNSYEAQLIRSNEQLKLSRDLAGDFASTLANGLRQGEGLWKSLGDAATSVLTKISDMLLNDVLNSLFRVNSAASSSGGGGLLSGLGSLLGLGGSSAFPPAPTSGLGLFANGGVFSNSIVTRPTLFPFANGTGLMGEAGPEAIMPLRRDASGRLGVSAPSNDNRSSGGSSIGGVHVSVGVTFDQDEGFRAYVKDVAQTEAGSAVQDGISQYDQQMPDRVAQINLHPRRR